VSCLRCSACTRSLPQLVLRGLAAEPRPRVGLLRPAVSLSERSRAATASIEELRRLPGAIRVVQPVAPIPCWGGHSACFVAHPIAVLLREQGEKIAFLVIFGHPSRAETTTLHREQQSSAILAPLAAAVPSRPADRCRVRG